MPNYWSRQDLFHWIEYYHLKPNWHHQQLLWFSRRCDHYIYNYTRILKNDLWTINVSLWIITGADLNDFLGSSYIAPFLKRTKHKLLTLETKWESSNWFQLLKTWILSHQLYLAETGADSPELAENSHFLGCLIAFIDIWCYCKMSQFNTTIPWIPKIYYINDGRYFYSLALT